MTDTCSLPAEGWTEPDERGHITFTMHGRISEPAPDREGWHARFIAVHGARFTRWTYEPDRKPRVSEPHPSERVTTRTLPPTDT